MPLSTSIKTLGDLITEMNKKGDVQSIAQSVSMQFGTDNEPLLGADLCPEKIVYDNNFSEGDISYRTVVANSGADFSPAQLNPGGNKITGLMNVKLGFSNQADQMNPQQIQDILNILKLSGDSTNNRDARAIAILTNFFDRAIARPLIVYNEIQRWQMWIDARIKRVGSNGYEEDVIYPNPAGHRFNVPSGTVAAPTGWYATDPNTTYDPIQEMLNFKLFMAKKGYRLVRAVTTFENVYQLINHPAIRKRFGLIVINPANNQLQSTIQSITLEQVNGLLNSFGLPSLEIYDTTYDYRAADGTIQSRRYIERDTHYPIVFFANTGKAADILLEDGESFTLDNTIGYTAVGTVPALTMPGRVIQEIVTEKPYPPTVYAEGLQESLPVNLFPEAVGVMRIMKPTP